jgi:carboxyl-terminal processing protease
LVTDGRPVVSAILPGSPAEGAQLLAGDIVVQIDGVDTLNESLSAIVQKLRGPKGSVVTLKILRDGQLMTVILERDLIVVPR